MKTMPDLNKMNNATLRSLKASKIDVAALLHGLGIKKPTHYVYSENAAENLESFIDDDEVTGLISLVYGTEKATGEQLKIIEELAWNSKEDNEMKLQTVLEQLKRNIMFDRKLFFEWLRARPYDEEVERQDAPEDYILSVNLANTMRGMFYVSSYSSKISDFEPFLRHVYEIHRVNATTREEQSMLDLFFTGKCVPWIKRGLLYGDVFPDYPIFGAKFNPTDWRAKVVNCNMIQLDAKLVGIAAKEELDKTTNPTLRQALRRIQEIFEQFSK